MLRYLSDPPSVHCPSVISHYGNTLKEMAAAEWFEQRTDLFDRRNLDLDTDVSRTGTYSCFCYNELINLDQDPRTLYKIEHVDGKNSTLLAEPICEKYHHYAIQNGFFVAQAYSQLIVLFAMGVRNAYAWLASKNRFRD